MIYSYCKKHQYNSLLHTTILLLVMYGCGSGSASTHEDIQNRIKNYKDSLTAAGVSMDTKSYPIGTATIVNLNGTQITDETIDNLIIAERISEFHAANSGINDSQLLKFSERGNTTYLNVIDLSNTQVTDTGILVLAGKSYLQHLIVDGTAITENGKKEFQNARDKIQGISAGMKKVKFTK